MSGFLVVAAAMAGLLLLVWAGQRRLIYFPFGRAGDPAAAGLPEAEPVAFSTEDGLALDGWFLAASGAPPEAEGKAAGKSPARRGEGGAAILILNGNAGNRSHRARLAAGLARAGYAVLLFDYRGYGGNPGHPTEEGLAADARAARAYLAGRPEVDPARLIYLGESLGAAVAVRLGLEHPPAALVLRSPFASLTSVASHHYPFLPVRWLLQDRFPSDRRIGSIGAPILIVAGEADRIVPADQSRRLFDAASEPKTLRILPGLSHNDPGLGEGPPLLAEVLPFLQSHVP